MSIQDEIKILEERLRQAELGPDAAFFEEVLANEVVLLSQDGKRVEKSKIVQAHRPGGGPKFTRVEMSDMVIRDYDSAAVVTCKGFYEGPTWSGTLQFMRVWVKSQDRWQIVAGSVAN